MVPDFGSVDDRMLGFGGSWSGRFFEGWRLEDEVDELKTMGGAISFQKSAQGIDDIALFANNPAHIGVGDF